MKFKFQFENVLKHRKILEDLANKDFQDANGALQIEINKMEFMKNQRHQAHIEAFEKQVGGGLAGPALSQVHDFLQLQDIRIEMQQSKVKEAEELVEKMREILRKRAIDYKIIDKLKEQRREEFNIEKNKIEQKRADDISTMRHMRLKEKEK